MQANIKTLPSRQGFLRFLRFSFICPKAVVVGCFRKKLTGFQLDLLRIFDRAAGLANLHVNAVVGRFVTRAKLMLLSHIASPLFRNIVCPVFAFTSAWSKKLLISCEISSFLFKTRVPLAALFVHEDGFLPGRRRLNSVRR